MRKLIAAMKLSVDGKVEGAEAMADWVQAWSDDYGLTPQIDACIIGGHMYPGYEGYWTGILNDPTRPGWKNTPPTAEEIEWARFAANTPHYVLSNTLTDTKWPNTGFLRSTGDIAALKQQDGKAIYLMGGAQTIASLIEAGLVDELRLIVYPLIAGTGKPLFADIKGRRRLELKKAEQLKDGLLSLIYEISQI